MPYQIILQFALIFIFLLSSSVNTQEDYIDFESDQWHRQDAAIVRFRGKKCLIGRAFLIDVEFENVIIEIDMAVKHARTYPGIIFRMQSEGNYERLNIRPDGEGGYLISHWNVWSTI